MKTVIEMARKAGLPDAVMQARGTWAQLERFAALVAAHEREACAKVCETDIEEGEAPWTACDYAAAIRARGE